MVKEHTDELSHSLEDYLETVYNLVRRNKVARVKEIAAIRGVKPGSVSPAMRRLAAMGLIRYEQREYIDLTAAGESRARRVVARHQILSTFFRDILQMDPDAADQDACAMEHSLSAEGMDRLTSLVEFLKGDSRIETDFRKRLGGGAEGATRKKTGASRSKKMTLAELEPGEQAVVERVRARGKKRQRLLELGILPDTVIGMERPAARGQGFVVSLQGFRVTLERTEAEAVIVARAP